MPPILFPRSFPGPTNWSAGKLSGGLLLLTFLLLSPRTALAGEDNPDEIVVGDFSAAQNLSVLPQGWEPLYFKNIPVHTEYHLVRDVQGLPVIEAVSNASSSGLIKKLTINPNKYPILTWRWRVSNIYQKGDMTKKKGDDYPARIYITFAYDAKKVDLWDRVKFNTIKLLYGQYPPIDAINYVWTSKEPIGLIAPNPYTDRVKMIVIESGAQHVNEWRYERRDLVSDYRKAFGTSPPPISGIAIMTDSDNTGESATAWYGDIVLSRGNGS